MLASVGTPSLDPLAGLSTLNLPLHLTLQEKMGSPEDDLIDHLILTLRVCYEVEGKDQKQQEGQLSLLPAPDARYKQILEQQSKECPEGRLGYPPPATTHLSI